MTDFRYCRLNLGATAELGRRALRLSHIHLRTSWITSIVLILLASFSTSADAQDDDDDANPAPNLARFEIQESQFDLWVFENMPSVKAAEAKLDKILALQIEDVDRACGLTPLQRKKLELAGHGDVKRFFEKVDVMRKKFLLVRKDQNKFNQLWQEIQPLQITFQSGLYENDSMFRKTLKNTLSSEQFEHYSELERDRHELHYRAKVELVVAMLESSLPLRDEQREKLMTLLVENGQRPRSYGQWDYYVIMWNLSKIPEEKVRPLFDNAEWRVLSAQLTQARGMEQMMKQNGVLLSDEEKK